MCPFLVGLLICGLMQAAPVSAEETTHKALIRDVVSIEGVRENPILGYGMVVGLKGTGDSQQTMFSTQTLANILQHMGVRLPNPATIMIKNVAAVFVTGSLPPFATPGTHIDITVASVGDAKSLQGGLLLLTPLYGADGKVYASAQGPLVLGGYTAGTGGNSKQLNHPTTGRIPEGGIVERDTSLDLHTLPRLSLMLNEPNFTTAEEMASVINHEFEKPIATVIDSRRVDLDNAASQQNIPSLLARVENLMIEVHRRAKVVVNERTGTVVMGRDVRLGAVSILHGNFSIEVATQYTVSQPNPLSPGTTAVVPEQNVKAQETPAQRVELAEGASVEQLVGGLQRIGATARDVIAILQAIKAAGALQADLEVI
jgi:flagellar P-ring protein FlgI